ncbi:MAG: PspC domain-containing protein [Oscillospiraceae bacterium]|nr:PspC domain-containing protein [Oscillospiraceae bacterium]
MKKKLYRIEEGKMLCGVCGGIAEYFDIDPTLVRLGFVLLSCAAGSALFVYIVTAIIIPVKSDIIDAG